MEARETGLRTTFVVAGAIGMAVLLVAVPRLTSARLREARDAAQDQA